MNTEATQHPIYITSAWGTSPRMCADAFAAEHFAEPRKVQAFSPDGTFCLVDGSRTYKVVAQPGVPGVSESTYGVVVVEDDGR